MDPLKDFKMILFGWLLGLFGPVIVNELVKWRNRGEAQIAIRTELNELRLKLIFSIYSIRMQLGTFDRDLLNWMTPMVIRYQGAHVTHPIVKAFEVLSNFNDAQLQAYVALQSSPPVGLSLKKYGVPYLEAKMDQLGAFSEQKQSILLSIKAHLELLNQEIDLAIHYTDKTFDSSLDENNHAIVLNNVKTRYRQAAEGAETVVNLINKLDGTA